MSVSVRFFLEGVRVRVRLRTCFFLRVRVRTIFLRECPCPLKMSISSPTVRTATHCRAHCHTTLPHTAAHCRTHCRTQPRTLPHTTALPHTATHTAAHCRALRRTSILFPSKSTHMYSSATPYSTSPILFRLYRPSSPLLTHPLFLDSLLLLLSYILPEGLECLGLVL